MKYGFLSATLLSLALAACQAPTPQQPLAGHLSTETSLPQARGDIPAPVQQTLAVPKPRTTPKTETYSVVVNNVQVKDLLFALARDAKVNVDIHPGITGVVSLNAINQTLPQLLTRISKQVDMRFELDGPNLSVMPDSPFLKHYKVDYVNMSRTVTGTVSTNTQINSDPARAAPAAPGRHPGCQRPATSRRPRSTNNSRNMFWEQLEKNIKDILHETDKVFPEGSSETVIEQANSQTSTGAAALPQGGGQRAAQTIANALQTNPAPGSSSQATGNSVVRRSTFREAASVIMNPESGVVTVRATSRQHEKIQEFIDRVITSSRRQVLIEATIVEVQLGDGYQQGIQWDRLRKDGSTKFSITPASVNSNVGTAVSPFTISFSQLGGAFDIAGMVNLLQSYGTAKVLSSPRLSVMNNQTALLKVVENFVYFNVKADTDLHSQRRHHRRRDHDAAIGLRRPGHDGHTANQRRRRGDSRTCGQRYRAFPSSRKTPTRAFRPASRTTYHRSARARSSRSCASTAAKSPSSAGSWKTASTGKPGACRSSARFP